MAASVVAWLLDDLLSSWAGLPLRVTVNLVVSVLVFLYVRRWLTELRGD